MGKWAGDLQKARMTETGKAKRKWERDQETCKREVEGKQGTWKREVQGEKRSARGQGTWNKDREREQRAGKGPGITEESKGMIKGNRQCHVCENDVAGVCGAVFSVMCEGIM